MLHNLIRTMEQLAQQIRDADEPDPGKLYMNPADAIMVGNAITVAGTQPSDRPAFMAFGVRVRATPLVPPGVVMAMTTDAFDQWADGINAYIRDSGCECVPKEWY